MKRRPNARQKVLEQKYKISQLKRADEFVDHADIISALFDSDELFSKSELRRKLSEHLEREV